MPAPGDTSFPFDNGDANEPEFRLMFQGLGDGIIDAPSAAGGAATVNSGTQTVTVAPLRVRSAGAVLNGTQPVSFTLTSVGASQPTSGQRRIDRVVARTDYAEDYVERVLLPGTPGPTASATAPELADDPNGVHDAPLWQIVRTVTGSGTTISLIDERAWPGGHTELTAAGDIAGPVGTTRGRGRLLWRNTPTGPVVHDADVGRYITGQSGGNGVIIAAGGPQTADIDTRRDFTFDASRLYEVTFGGRLGMVATPGASLWLPLELWMVDDFGAGFNLTTTAPQVIGRIRTLVPPNSLDGLDVQKSVPYRPTTGAKKLGMFLRRPGTSTVSMRMVEPLWFIKDVGPR